MIDEWGKGAKYWDHAWNPVIGCKKVSEGCANCYAKSIIRRFNMNGNIDPDYDDYEVQTAPHLMEKLKAPPKSGVVFVGNMTDIFGEWNTDEQIRDWLYKLHMNDDVTNLILTKRPERSPVHPADPASWNGWKASSGSVVERKSRFSSNSSTSAVNSKKTSQSFRRNCKSGRFRGRAGGEE